MNNLSLKNLKECLVSKQKILATNDHEYTGLQIKKLLDKILACFLVPQKGAIGIICEKNLNFLFSLSLGLNPH